LWLPLAFVPPNFERLLKDIICPRQYSTESFNSHKFGYFISAHRLSIFFNKHSCSPDISDMEYPSLVDVDYGQHIKTVHNNELNQCTIPIPDNALSLCNDVKSAD